MKNCTLYAIKKRNGDVHHEKRVFVLTLIFLVIFSLISTFSYLTDSSKISPGEISGFGVDSSNNLYIGKRKGIAVYKGGKLIREIVPLTSRSYCFVVNADDTIFIGRDFDYKAFSTDLYGENVVELDCTAGDIRREMHENMVIERNGAVYQCKNALPVFKPYSILRDGEVIYSMPILDYIFGFPYIVLVLILFSLLFIKAFLKK